MENLNLHDDEPELELQEAEGQASEPRQPLCLVGRFLTNKPIRTQMMRERMAEVWQPGRGISIREAKPSIFLFRFYHQLDIQKVTKLGPWSFDNHLLILSVLHDGQIPSQVPLFTVPFWVQVHNVPVGCMSLAVGEQIGNYLGEFLEYDAKNNSNFWRAYMRIRVLLDVRQPLKQVKKIKKQGMDTKVVSFKYERLTSFCYLCGLLGHVDSLCERLTSFCYLCGLLGHVDSLCEKRFDMPMDDGTRNWGPEIKADVRKRMGSGGSRWFREEDQDEWKPPNPHSNYNCGVYDHNAVNAMASVQGKVANQRSHKSWPNMANFYKDPSLFYAGQQGQSSITPPTNQAASATSQGERHINDVTMEDDKSSSHEHLYS